MRAHPPECEGGGKLESQHDGLSFDKNAAEGKLLGVMHVIDELSSG